MNDRENIGQGRLLALTAVVMVAFAANSVLNRAGLLGGDIGPAAFAAIRVASGAAMLVLLVALSGRLQVARRSVDPLAVAGLTAYMLGFSFAYVRLDAGLGALALFGGVQITMFAGAVLAHRTPRPAQWLGSGVAFLGLVLLFDPRGASADLLALGLMTVAAVGWGVYSLRGARATDALAASCANFVLCLPLVVMAALVAGEPAPGGQGVLLAVIAGAVTSALGYALWYRVLPSFQPAAAAVAQLSVPVIAALGGIVLLSEPLTLRFAVSAALVIGGIAFATLRRG